MTAKRNKKSCVSAIKHWKLSWKSRTKTSACSQFSWNNLSLLLKSITTSNVFAPHRSRDHFNKVITELASHSPLLFHNPPGHKSQASAQSSTVYRSRAGLFLSVRPESSGSSAHSDATRYLQESMEWTVLSNAQVHSSFRPLSHLDEEFEYADSDDQETKRHQARRLRTRRHRWGRTDC